MHRKLLPLTTQLIAGHYEFAKAGFAIVAQGHFAAEGDPNGLFRPEKNRLCG